MPHYIVTDNQDPKNPVTSLVNAKTKAAALAAVVEPRFEVKPATMDDAIALTAKGVKVVTA